MSAKQAINSNLQCSVATCLRCGGVINNQIKKGLMLSLWLKFFFYICEYLAKLQAIDCLLHFLRLLAVCWPGEQSLGPP